VRDSVRTQYAESVIQHRMRLLGLGAPPALLEALTPERRPWPAQLVSWFGQVALNRPEFETPPSKLPVVDTEFELWKLEREALLRRLAGVSVEIHKKFSLPAACVVFVLLGAPLGMRVRRAGPSVAFLAVPFFLFYYICLVGGEELATRLLFPPWLSMWIANIVLGAWGLVASWRACELPGLPFRRRGARA
jgi:lipopolysaccharide export LptBFGC system permease protein LptF